jgi:large subunit ribosomal protein L23
MTSKRNKNKNKNSNDFKKINKNSKSTRYNKKNKDNKKNDKKETGKNSTTLSPDQAAEMIKEPYITEKTFNMIERENKLSFIVADKANKTIIADALQSLYASDITDVNTFRTIRGKKAIVKFGAPEGARDLATKLGLV